MLVALGLVVIIAAVGLHVEMAGSGPVAAAPRNAEQAIGAASPIPSRPPDPADRAARAAATESPSGSDYTVGDVRIRDHRAGTHEQLDVAPVIHAPSGIKIASQLSSDIAKSLRSVVAECAAAVPADARGPKARFEGQLKIAIKDRRATITSAAIRLRDVTGEPLAAQQCLEQNVIGISTPSGNEPDMEGYGITLSLRLP